MFTGDSIPQNLFSFLQVLFPERGIGLQVFPVPPAGTGHAGILPALRLEFTGSQRSPVPSGRNTSAFGSFQSRFAGLRQNINCQPFPGHNAVRKLGGCIGLHFVHEVIAVERVMVKND